MRPASFLFALVVDDDARAVTTLRRGLARAGILWVRHEPTIEGALEAAGDAPDLIVTELLLRGGSVLPFLEPLRTRASHASIVAVSGQATQSQVLALPALGVSAFLEKPLSEEGVAATVRSLDEARRDRLRSIAGTQRDPASFKRMLGIA